MDKALKISGTTVRLALIGMAAITLGGCADLSRMGGDPLGNPFQTSSRFDRNPTGTINQPQQSSGNFFTDAFKPFGDNNSEHSPRPPADIDQPRYAPQHSSLIQSEPLAPPSAAPAHAAWSAPGYAPGVTHSASLARPKATGVGGWSPEGGTPIVVAQGENAEIIAQRYGVPLATLLRLNGYNTRAQVQPGARMVIPVYHAEARSASLAPAEARPARMAHVESRQEASRLAQPKAHPVMTASRGEPPHRLGAEPKYAETQKFVAGPNPVAMETHDAATNLAGRRARLAEAKMAQAKMAQAKLAQANATDATRRAAEAQLKQQERIARREQEKADAEAKKLAAMHAPKQTAVAELTAPEPAASKFTKTHASAVDRSATTASLEPAAPSVASGGDAAHPEFRWPARGRVIQAFGAGGNDGINIAVPDGTPVKAAESGVVAYAGSELKGYGNLVLIRHPNGFVSAYANNGSLDVKRGDTVKRGQTIALSGQSGNVASPQLHFELRKGSKPVDPSSYLAGL